MNALQLEKFPVKQVDVQSLRKIHSTRTSPSKSLQSAKSNGLVDSASPAQEATDVCLDLEQTQGVLKLLKTVARGDVELVSSG